MRGKMQANKIPIVIFILGILLETYYILSLFSSQMTLSEMIEKTFFTGILTAILIVITIVLLRQDKITKGFKSGSFVSTSRSPKQVRRELSRLYSDLGATKILYNDGLMKQKEYDSRHLSLEKSVTEKKKELRLLENRAKNAK